MIRLLLIASLLSLPTYAFELSGMDVIYGEDNRRDLYEVKNQLFLRLANSTAGMIAKSDLAKTSSGHFEIRGRQTLSAEKNICSDEPFAKQSVAPICSGFLVGPDLLLTAGHCYFMMGNPQGECRDFAWVFDYNIPLKGKNPAKKIFARDVYSCRNIVAGKFEPRRLMDYALIRLDRKVMGRAPLEFRQRGILPAATPLVVIGHPSGLPTKISHKGTVTYNRNKHTFSTTLDTFHANSGSGVFNSRTGLLEGILIQGKTDYIPSNPKDSNSCQVLNVCDNNAKKCLSTEDDSPSTARGEVVFRIDVIQSEIEKALLK